MYSLHLSFYLFFIINPYKHKNVGEDTEGKEGMILSEMEGMKLLDTPHVVIDC
jgi:hypothetical protein